MYYMSRREGGAEEGGALVGSAGPNPSVFQSEVLAIKMCAEELLRRGVEGRRVSICCDSRAALGALDSCRVSSRLTLECREALDNLGRNNNIVVLYWVPAHVGIEGNEIADRAAKGGTTLASPTEAVGVPWAAVTRAIKEWAAGLWTREWAHIKGCRRSKEALGKSALYKWSGAIISMPRGEARHVVGWISGHWSLNNHVWGPVEERRICRFCELDVETTEHILWRCPAVERRRMGSLGSYAAELQDQVPLVPQAIWRFVRAVGLDEMEWFSGS